MAQERMVLSEYIHGAELSNPEHALWASSSCALSTCDVIKIRGGNSSWRWAVNSCRAKANPDVQLDAVNTCAPN